MASSPSAFASVPEMIAELRAGRMIILVDDESRENEGDFVVAAERLQVEHVVAMNRIASGIITVPMPPSWLRRLHIDPMVQENAESMHTAFTVTVDAKEGVSTGSSAQDRVVSIRKLADPASRAEDFVRPGMLLVTGVVTRNMAAPLQRTLEATPKPRVVLAVGDCAVDCGMFRDGYGVVGAVGEVVPVDLGIPGCPPEPADIVAALRRVTGR